jgi:hypothetical protein
MKIWKAAITNSLATAVYITLVATFMTNGEKIFGKGDNVFTGIGILLLFTLSALIVGTLVLGKPLKLYLDGEKKEAVRLLIQTILVLAIITIAFLSILAAIK